MIKIRFAFSVGEVDADQDLVGLPGAEVLREAINRTVEKAENACGYPFAAGLK